MNERLLSARTHLKRNAVAYFALFFALGGSAYAVSTAPKNSVVSKSIQDGEVKTQDLSPTATAPDASKLGGLAPSAYQPQIGSQVCPTGISSIRNDGYAECAPAHVRGFNERVPSGGYTTLGDYGSARIAVDCNDGAGGTRVSFQNQATSNATLDWLYNDGTNSSVNAGGVTLQASGTSSQKDFSFDRASNLATNRIEGQFIYSDGSSVSTVNLHAVDFDSNGCEAIGTVETTAN
jgi:hypothetical protein